MIGKDSDQARDALRALGFKISFEEKVSSSQPDTIIGQSPKAGSELEPKSTVKVIVAKQPIVPDIKAQHIDQIPRLLADRSFEVGTITYQASLEPADTVLEQNPQAGASARFGAAIDIVLAKRLHVPNLLGESVEDAKGHLTPLDFRIGTLSERRSDAPPGTIVEQIPKAGVSALPGTAIEIVVAAPPVVPDVLGSDLDEAEATLKRHFLKSGPIRYVFAESFTVQRQKPAPGSVVAPKSPVELTLGAPKPSPPKPETVQVPDIIGLEVDDATEQVLDAGLSLAPDVPTEQVPQKVVRQMPKAGQWVAVGTSALIVGERINEVTVPDLSGLPVERALALLKEAHLAKGPMDKRLERGAARPGRVQPIVPDAVFASLDVLR